MNTINVVNSNEYSVTLKALRKTSKNEKGADNIKNLTIFSLCITILLRGIETRPVRDDIIAI